jgi:hypothetical protein
MKEEPSRALLATRAANTFLSLMWNDELVPLAICLTFHFARKREQWRPARVRCVDKGHRFPAAARYLAPRERERERDERGGANFPRFREKAGRHRRTSCLI